MKRQYLTFSQRVQIYNFIKTVGKANGEHWEYAEGWSDRRVAEQFKSSVGNVATVRMELGKLMTGSGAPYSVKLAQLENIVNDHEKNLLPTICGEMERLKDKVKELEAKLSRVQLKEHFRA